MDDNFYQLIVSGIMLAFIIGIFVVVTAIGGAEDKKVWNNGYCECGGKWVYQQAVGHRCDTDYIYKCDKCGNIHEFEVAR